MSVDVRLNAIVDPERANGRSLADLARLVVAGGATLIQLRDKHGATRQMIEQARAIKAALAGTGVPLVVNDRVDVALIAQADGVHVGQEDMRPQDARRLLGPQGPAAPTWARRTGGRRRRGVCSDRGRSSAFRSRAWRGPMRRRSTCSIMWASAASMRPPRRTPPPRRSG